ncbi:PAS domain S-box protein [Methanosarcina hadiensis]|uniref:PAS domain S-box protein n=1 Tax=Methanosarcina hadiensis TaxID=3078083 RepID=UPI0039773C8C
MTYNSLGAKEQEIKVQERIAELEKANQELRTEIIEHKQAEEAFREREEKYRNIIETVNEGIWVVDPEGRITYANKKMAEILGYTQDEIAGRNSWDFTDKENKSVIKSIIERRKQGVDESYELRFIRKDGSFLWALINARSVFNKDGKFTGSTGTLTDITEHKQAREDLIKSERGFRTLAENSPDWIARLDRQKRYMYINPAAVEFYGVTQESIIGKTNTELRLSPEKTKFWNEYFEKVFATGKPETIEYLYKSPEGKECYFDTQIVPEFASGKVTSVLAISRNITGIKEAEARLKETLNSLENQVKERTAELEAAYQSLKESEKGLADAQKMAHLGNWSWDLITGEVYWSDELYRIFGRDPQKPGASYEELLNYVHPDSRGRLENTIKGRLDGGARDGIDYRIILENGEGRVVHSRAEVVCNEQNTPVRVNGIVQDVTEQRLASKKLQQSEERYRMAAEQTGQLVFDFRMDTQKIEWAGAIREITGYDPDEFRSLDESFWIEHIHPDDRDRMVKSHKGFFRKLQRIQEEFRLRKKDGNYIYLEMRGVWLRDEEGKAFRAVGIIKDITERKQTEEFLASIEIARQKEIHHRIKNNLQVISSLLDLQAEKFNHRKCIEDSEVLDAFRESKDRVMSIALIHEELHEGEKDNALDFSLYLRRLIENLFKTYKVGNTEINLDTNLEGNIFFDMDIAVPLGMIVNELISNSLKYAFPGRENGNIKIKLYGERYVSESDNKGQPAEEFIRYTLVVSDNGIGIPENIDIESPETLGLQLVNILVTQLDAEIELRRGKGTEYIICFTNAEK